MVKYRSDIEGLRAIAVGSILLYHFGFASLSGGYVGVDIFFVISGFLIGRSIIDQALAGQFSFADFLERRVRRLFPALVAMLAVTTVVAWLLLLPFDLRSYGKSLIGTAVYVSNIVFFREAGYFDQGAIYKPLLHTWSLAVEEQFYLTFPPLMLLLLRFSRTRRAALGWLALIGILSFAGAQIFLGIDPSASFYIFPFRAWELLTGVAIGFLNQQWVASRPRAWREAVAATGILLVLVPIFTYSHHTPFPGLTAMPPVLGTALLIGTGGGTSVARFLSLRPFTLIGLISYSLYLWHWPIVVALAYYFAGEVPLVMTAAGIAATGLMSLLSWRYVEEPFRRRRYLPESRAFFLLMAAISLGLIGIGGFFYKTDGVPTRYDAEGQRIAVASGDFLQKGGTCFNADNQTIPDLAFCLLGDARAEPSFLVWGDSHGRAFRDGIDMAAREAGRSGLLVWAGGCPPLAGIRKVESAGSPAVDKICIEQNERLLRLLETDRSLQSVLLIGRWAYYTEGRGIGADDQNVISIHPADGSEAAAGPLFTDGMRRTVELLRSQGRRVLVLEQVPEVPPFNARTFAQLVLSRGEAPETVLDRIGTVDEQQVDRRQKVAEAVLRELERTGEATILRTHPFFCRDGQCHAWMEGHPALFDNNHITVATSIDMRELFRPLFGSGNRAVTAAPEAAPANR